MHMLGVWQDAVWAQVLTCLGCGRMRYGLKSWKPWLVALAMEVASLVKLKQTWVEGGLQVQFNTHHDIASPFFF